MDYVRSIEVKMSVPNISPGSRGFFHRWTDQPYIDCPLDYPIRRTFALIELLDGNMILLDPETIRFLEPYTKAK